VLQLETYYPIIFEHIALIPEFLEILRTNSQRLDGLLDITVSGPDAKTHSYVALLKKPKLPLETHIAGFRVAYILPEMGITSFDPTYKGTGKRIKETIASVAILSNIKPIAIESSVCSSKPFADYNDYLKWWKLIVSDIQPKLNNR
jgi:hypothetical protein